MRPAGAHESPQQPRKRSFVDRVSPFAEARSTAPTTFFLAKGPRTSPEIDGKENIERDDSHGVQSLENTLDGLREPGQRPNLDLDPPTASPPKQSPTAISNTEAPPSQPLTPLFISSPADGSLPSSPKSTSVRSARQTELEFSTDDGESQVLESEEDGQDVPEVHDSSPQLIMPSIKMPSRRPFTSRGKEMGRIKIVLAGGKGKSSYAFPARLTHSF